MVLQPPADSTGRGSNLPEQVAGQMQSQVHHSKHETLAQCWFMFAGADVKWFALDLLLDQKIKNEMNRALGHLCAHIG